MIDLMTFREIAEKMTDRGYPITPQTAHGYCANALRKLKTAIEDDAELLALWEELAAGEPGLSPHRRNRRKNLLSNRMEVNRG